MSQAERLQLLRLEHQRRHQERSGVYPGESNPSIPKFDTRQEEEEYRVRKFFKLKS